MTNQQIKAMLTDTVPTKQKFIFFTMLDDA